MLNLVNSYATCGVHPCLQKLVKIRIEDLRSEGALDDIARLCQYLLRDSSATSSEGELILESIVHIVDKDKTDSTMVTLSKNSEFTHVLVAIIEACAKALLHPTKTVRKVALTSHRCYELALYTTLGLVNQSKLIKNFVGNLGMPLVKTLMKTLSETLVRDILYFTQEMSLEILCRLCHYFCALGRPKYEPILRQVSSPIAAALAESEDIILVLRDMRLLMATINKNNEKIKSFRVELIEVCTTWKRINTKKVFRAPSWIDLCAEEASLNIEEEDTLVRLPYTSVAHIESDEEHNAVKIDFQENLGNLLSILKSDENPPLQKYPSILVGFSPDESCFEVKRELERRIISHNAFFAKSEPTLKLSVVSSREQTPNDLHGAMKIACNTDPAIVSKSKSPPQCYDAPKIAFQSNQNYHLNSPSTISSPDDETLPKEDIEAEANKSERRTSKRRHCSDPLLPSHQKKKRMEKADSLHKIGENKDADKKINVGRKRLFGKGDDSSALKSRGGKSSEAVVNVPNQSTSWNCFSPNQRNESKARMRKSTPRHEIEKQIAASPTGDNVQGNRIHIKRKYGSSASIPALVQSLGLRVASTDALPQPNKKLSGKNARQIKHSPSVAKIPPQRNEPKSSRSAVQKKPELPSQLRSRSVRKCVEKVSLGAICDTISSPEEAAEKNTKSLPSNDECKSKVNASMFQLQETDNFADADWAMDKKSPQSQRSDVKSDSKQSPESSPEIMQSAILNDSSNKTTKKRHMSSCYAMDERKIDVPGKSEMDSNQEEKEEKTLHGPPLAEFKTSWRRNTHEKSSPVKPNSTAPKIASCVDLQQPAYTTIHASTKNYHNQQEIVDIEISDIGTTGNVNVTSSEDLISSVIQAQSQDLQLLRLNPTAKNPFSQNSMDSDEDDIDAPAGRGGFSSSQMSSNLHAKGTEEEDHATSSTNSSGADEEDIVSALLAEVVQMQKERANRKRSKLLQNVSNNVRLQVNSYLDQWMQLTQRNCDELQRTVTAQLEPLCLQADQLCNAISEDALRASTNDEEASNRVRSLQTVLTKLKAERCSFDHEFREDSDNIKLRLNSLKVRALDTARKTLSMYKDMKGKSSKHHNKELLKALREI